MKASFLLTAAYFLTACALSYHEFGKLSVADLVVGMRVELQRVQRETGDTMVFVTHDQSEALALAV